RTSDDMDLARGIPQAIAGNLHHVVWPNDIFSVRALDFSDHGGLECAWRMYNCRVADLQRGLAPVRRAGGPCYDLGRECVSSTMQVRVRNLLRQAVVQSSGGRGIAEQQHDAAGADAIHRDGRGLKGRRGTWGDGNLSKPKRRKNPCRRLPKAAAG